MLSSLNIEFGVCARDKIANWLVCQMLSIKDTVHKSFVINCCILTMYTADLKVIRDRSKHFLSVEIMILNSVLKNNANKKVLLHQIEQQFWQPLAWAHLNAEIWNCGDRCVRIVIPSYATI